jgi:outer membrane protein OmpA-like peptidoglycan-associated protein
MRTALPVLKKSNMKTYSLLLVILILPFLASAQSFKKGCRKFKRGKLHTAERIFRKYQHHPTYDLGAEYYLLRLRTRRARTLGEWAQADSTLADLARRYNGIDPEKAAKLKKRRASQRTVQGTRLRFQRQAIRFAEQNGTLPVLDSVARLFGEWLPAVRSDWDTARAHVVNRALPTTDYDAATSILNRHTDVVYRCNYPHIWTLREHIWDYFKVKYALCAMDRFRTDHPAHLVSADCWFDPARDMFCTVRLDSALAFHRRYPFTVLEFEVMDHIFALDRPAVATRLSAGEKQHLADLYQYLELLRALRCGEAPGPADIEPGLRAYCLRYAPRRSAWALLQTAAGFYARSNHRSELVELLTDLRPAFVDSLVCTPGYVFQSEKQPWFDEQLGCLERQVFALERAEPAFSASIEASRFSAVSWDDGHEVYFAIQQPKGMRIFRALRRADSTWLPAAPVPEFAALRKPLPLSLTEDGLEMLLKVGSKLYISRRNAEREPWGPLVRLPFRTPGLSRAVFAPDGSAILLDAARGRATMFGPPAPDLFYSLRRPDGAFGELQRLGRTLNTGAPEINPYLCADGRTLFFCSAGHGGSGQLDVFVSRRINDSWTAWTEPENVGCHLNTATDDFGFTWVPEDGREAYFTQVNPCTNALKIRSTELPPVVRPQPRRRLRGWVLDSQGRPVPKAAVELRLGSASLPVVLPVSAGGEYRYTLPDSVRRIRIYAEAYGYFTPRDTTHDLTHVARGTVLRDTFRLRSLSEIRREFQLHYATFDENTARLNNPRVYDELDLLYRFATRMNATLRFVGHTDNTGTDRRNAELSRERADTVVQYMLRRYRLPAKRLQAEGRGASQPKCSNETPQGRLCNRRVEIEFDLPPGHKPPASSPQPVVVRNPADGAKNPVAGTPPQPVAEPDDGPDDEYEGLEDEKPQVAEAPAQPGKKPKRWWSKVWAPFKRKKVR